MSIQSPALSDELFVKKFYSTPVENIIHYERDREKAQSIMLKRLSFLEKESSDMVSKVTSLSQAITHIKKPSSFLDSISRQLMAVLTAISFMPSYCTNARALLSRITIL